MNDRQVFEEWAYALGNRQLQRNDVGAYENSFTFAYWEFWKAGREALREKLSKELS